MILLLAESPAEYAASVMPLTNLAVVIARVMLGIGILLGIWRVWRGPGLPDRVVAIDLLGALAVGICILTLIQAHEAADLIVAMVMALLLFVSTLAASHYLLAAKADRIAAQHSNTPIAADDPAATDAEQENA